MAAGPGSTRSPVSPYSIPTGFQARNILKDIAPSWRFIAILPEIDTQVGSSIQFSANGGASYSSTPTLKTPQTPIARCADTDIPPVTIDTDPRFGGGKNIYVARTISSSPITLNLYEDDKYSVSRYIWAWHRKVVTEDNLYELPINYKKELQLWAFGNLSNTAPALIVKCIDCFPTITPAGLQYSQAESGFLTVSTELTIDKMEMEFTA